MKNTPAGIVFSLVLMLVPTACERDQDTLLTDGSWSFHDMTTSSEESAIISIVSLAKALLTDATLEFQEGGSYMISSPYLQEPTTGEWQLIGEDQLVLEPEGEAASTSRIETLNRDRLSYSESFVDAQMNSYTVTTTWTKN